MQAFSACFMKFCLALNSYKMRKIVRKEKAKFLDNFFQAL